jgi:hypothetical protein
MNDNTASTTTDFACPAWCDGGIDDSFEIESATGQPVRFHERVITRNDGVDVWLAALERITPTGHVVEPVTIGISSVSGFGRLDAMTPAQARALEAALATALAQAHEIAGA